MVDYLVVQFPQWRNEAVQSKVSKRPSTHPSSSRFSSVVAHDDVLSPVLTAEEFPVSLLPSLLPCDLRVHDSPRGHRL